jgi:hypothetical protein
MNSALEAYLNACAEGHGGQMTDVNRDSSGMWRLKQGC